ncbi:hypothetical protein NBRC116601_31750 [Cognatishimia sp. WU-CL00825]|uniref:FliH/SctL family protein n=1 Tax=Cognatishimia sp. WU-CL00825 TaxID=3127658 RepID=UPI0031056599
MMALILRDFDAETDQINGHGAAQGEAPAAPVYTFTEDELTGLLAEARAQGMEMGETEGRQAGRREILEAQEVKSATALEDIRQQLTEFLAQDAARRTELERDLVDMVLEISERIAPDLIKTMSADLVQARLKDAMRLGARQSKLSLRLSPDTEAAIAADLRNAFVAEQVTNADIIADPSLTNGEAKMSWENGFMNYSLDRICAELLDALRQASAQLKP